MPSFPKTLERTLKISMKDKIGGKRRKLLYSDGVPTGFSCLKMIYHLK